MKKLTALIGAAAFALAAVFVSTTASAQTYSPNTKTVAIVAAGVTTNLYATTNTTVLDVRKQHDVAILVNSGAATNSTWTFGRSIDGINYTTNKFTLFTGTGGSVVETNVSALGWGYFRVETVQNGDNAVIATNTIIWSTKIGAP